MKDKIFIFILFILTVFHFWGINWGTPSTKKTLQIFNSFAEFKEYVPTMVELIKKFYSSMKKIHIEGNIEKAIEETYAHQLKSQPFSELSKETKLVKKYFNKNIGVLSCIFVCILPLVIANSKMSKPHTLYRQKLVGI